MQEHVGATSIQQRARTLFHELGYTLIDGAEEETGPCRVTGRRHLSEVVLLPRLRAALRDLNKDCPDDLLDRAIEALTQDRSAFSLARANQEVYRLLKDGVKIDLRNRTVVEEAGDDEQTKELAQEAGKQADRHAIVRVIDWEQPDNNDFALVSHYWISGQWGSTCLDLVGFVNGLPFILLVLEDAELLDLHGRINAYKENLPRLFWYNASIIVSNGFISKIGSLTAPRERFVSWKRIQDVRAEESTTLETLLRGTCDKTRLLDLVENFTLFDTKGGGLHKLLAMNHQYLGVNNAYAALQRKKPEERGKLGVFWHTQGSGKSYSMVFFVLKVLRKLGGDYTFVIVTDRKDLDQQIYENFKNVGAIIELPKDARASNGAHLQQLLSEKHRIVFTLIQKFKAERPGAAYPELSARDNIIVITDEAHRSEYDALAKNMRDAVPNASFIGFTGTPLMDGEEQTRETFGDYISTYNFRRAIKDGITVPLYFENRTPELHLSNDNFGEEMAQLLARLPLDDDQVQMIEDQYAREDHFLVQDERLERIAEDIVEHFMNRGYMGKAMVVSIDKLTTVRMYTKVRRYWQAYQDRLSAQLAQERDPDGRAQLTRLIDYMKETEMAVVVSSSEKDSQKFAAFEQRTGERLDIAYHHRIFREGKPGDKLEDRFKAADHPLRIVFVCAMWMTGFDVPALSTLYLDRPLRNHTLMQAIARPNRVFKDKPNGLIVDYVGTVHDLEEALAVYAREEHGAIDTRDRPVGDKSELIQILRDVLLDMATFCQQQGIDVRARLAALAATTAKGQQLALIRQDVDRLLASDDARFGYLTRALDVRRFYNAILPDRSASAYTAQAHLYQLIEREIYQILRPSGIAETMELVSELVQRSLETVESEVQESLDGYSTPGSFDLNDIDLEALAADLQTGAYRHIKVEQLRGQLTQKLKRMIGVNKSRADLMKKLERAIDRYNDGSKSYAIDPPLIDPAGNVTSYSAAPVREREPDPLDRLDADLIEIAGQMQQEEERHRVEQLSEEDLAVFDIVIRDVQLNDEERAASKAVVRALMRRVREKIVRTVEWSVKPQTRYQMQVIVEEELNKLPAAPVYTQEQYDQKCEEVFRYIVERYRGSGGSSVA